MIMINHSPHTSSVLKTVPFINLIDILTCFVSLRLEVLGSKGEAEDESEGVGVAVDAGGVQGRPPLHGQDGNEEGEAAEKQLHDLRDMREMEILHQKICSQKYHA